MRPDDFADLDPISRAIRATELIVEYEMSTKVLARIRREALIEALQLDGESMTSLAAKLGVTKGRVSQIIANPGRSSVAPAPQMDPQDEG